MTSGYCECGSYLHACGKKVCPIMVETIQRLEAQNEQLREALQEQSNGKQQQG